MTPDERIENLVTALEKANDRWNNLYAYINDIAYNTRPYEDARDAGYDEACLNIMGIMEEMDNDTRRKD